MRWSPSPMTLSPCSRLGALVGDYRRAFGGPVINNVTGDFDFTIEDADAGADLVQKIASAEAGARPLGHREPGAEEAQASAPPHVQL